MSKETFMKFSPESINNAVEIVNYAHIVRRTFPTNPDAIAFDEGVRRWFRRYPIDWNKMEEPDFES